jgi:hypothetical protein
MENTKESSRILNLITKLKEDNKQFKSGKLSDNELYENNKTLIDNYPTIASKIKDDTLDMGIITPMLSSLDSITCGSKTEHQASVDIGTLLRDKFVIPDMKNKGLNTTLNNNLQNLDKEEATKKVNELLK